MPREIRKRGKRKSKTQKEQHEEHEPVSTTFEPEPQQEAGPSWMRNASAIAGSKRVEELEAPFGYLDADVKAYFRTVDLKLREWQDGTVQDLPEGIDTNEGESHQADFFNQFLRATQSANPSFLLH
jgi:nucleolar protein 9